MKVSTVLDSIDLGNMALPEFQRGYVWNREQVRALMQSLYKKYPVGGLLIWSTSGDAAATRGTNTEAANTVNLLLDGQQRITSLYGLMRGYAPAFFEGNDKAFTGLYFDVRSETFEFYGPVKMSGDPLWVNVTDLFKTELALWISTIAGLDIGGEAQAQYISRLTHVLAIRDRELPVEEITGAAMTIDEVVDIFNRVNSGGTKLSKGDLALARICATWPEARDAMNDKLDQWSAVGFKFKLDWLLRVTNALLTGEAEFAALRDADRDDFRDSLTRAGDHCDRLLNLIANRLGLDHHHVLPGIYAFPVMARFLDRSDQLTALDESRLLYWYINAGLWGRFSGSTETVLNQDLEAVDTDGLDGLLRQLRIWRGDLSITDDNFAGAERGSRFYPLLYMMNRVGGARDFVTGDLLSANLLGRLSTLQLHHIFPKAMLKELGYGRSDRNALANFCFLTQDSNLDIGRRSPAEHLEEVETMHPGVLASQWIPSDPELWSEDRYPDFLAARRELLAAAANEMLNGLLFEELGLPLEELGDAGLSSDQREPEQATADDDALLPILEMCQAHALAAPDIAHEIVDETTGELLAWADAAWPSGLQEGLTEPVAFLTEPDEELETRLGELGYRFFTSIERLTWYIETLLGVDIDGDGVVGEVDHAR